MKNLFFYLKKAEKEKWAIPQFNFSTLNQLKGIVNAAKSLKSPIILGTSMGEANFFGLKEAVLLRDFYRKILNIPIFLNLDHGKNLNIIKEAIKFGYDMVHFDGSDLLIGENIRITKKVKKLVNKKRILVEGEIGRIPTESSRIYFKKFKIKEDFLTKPEDALNFYKQTKVDLLAVSIGTFHGIEISGKNPKINIKRLKEIKKILPNVGLVLHGGSGTRNSDIKKAIKNGIVKINVNTELRLAFTEAIRKKFKENKEEIVPYKYLPFAEKRVQKITEDKIKLFNSFNKI